MTEKKPYRGAKIPSPDNSIRVRRTVCDICSAGCNIDVYIENGKVIKVTGCKDPAFGNGYLCARGHANRPYIYHEERIKTPLRRCGGRGEGKFEPISWEEALDEVGKRLLECRRRYDGSAVAFTSGGNPWNRAVLQRMARSFGSVNYGSSWQCQRAGVAIASQAAAGCTCRPDIEHAGVVIMWGCNPYNKGNTVVNPVLTQKRGAKVIAVDPRVTVSTCRLADLHLRPRPGTDAALACGLGRIFIENGWVDKNYVEQHVQGYFEYRAYVSDFTPERVEELTGVSAQQLEAAAHMIMRNGPLAMIVSEGAFSQMRGGVQTCRAIEALCVITGNYDVRGGMLPQMRPALEDRVLRKFVSGYADGAPGEGARAPAGAGHYPLFTRFTGQCHMADLPRQIRQGTPYPIRALCALGLNMSEFPNDGSWADALQSLDFFVDVDLFMTRTAKYADIVLPACSSFEREMLHVTPEHKIYYTPAVIAPLGDARSDLDILCALARRITPEDRLLCAGPSHLYDEWLSRMDLSLDILKNAPEPIQLAQEPYIPGEYTAAGFHTPSGRYELRSTLMSRAGFDALPEYVPPRSAGESRDWPFLLSVGNRQTFGFHSRTHRIAWIRAMQPAPAVELHPDDAKVLGIAQGDMVEIRTPLGAVQMLAQLTRSIQRGMAAVLPDYEEADICAILPENVVDPCSGIPALRAMSCRISKA